MAGICVGVVGLGLGRHHVAAYADSPDVGRLVVCDSDPARLEAVRGERPQVVAAYGDLEEMLAAERLDAVSIITPDHLHRPHVQAAVAAGAHVLVTKPLATTLDDGRAMISAAEEAERKLMVAHERRFRADWMAVKDVVDSGALGEVVYVSIATVQDKRRQFAERPWYASAQTGRSALVGTGIHQVDLARWLVGRPVASVQAVGSRLGELEYPADKTTAAVLKFDGGAVAQVTVVLVARWPAGGARPDPFWLIGTGGMIYDGQVALDGRDGWQPLPAAETIIEGTRRCVASFLRSILDDTPVAVDGREGFASLAAAVAADESAATAKAVVPAGADFK